MEANERSERVAEISWGNRPEAPQQPELIEIRLLDKIETIQSKASTR
ncbi:hypothetical protein ACIQVC_15250 [Streptomyces sp. NPDC101112]